jgi:hypothetical protein
MPTTTCCGGRYLPTIKGKRGNTTENPMEFNSTIPTRIHNLFFFDFIFTFNLFKRKCKITGYLRNKIAAFATKTVVKDILWKKADGKQNKYGVH